MEDQQAPDDTADPSGRRDGCQPGHETLHHKAKSVDSAPNDEGPSGAVPEPTKQHGGHQVPGRAGPAAPVPTKADIQVVAQPRTQADMPPPPEVLQRQSPVWLVEVGWEPETEEQRDFLLDRGCEEFQGYLYCRPIPDEQFRAFCRDYAGAAVGE